MTRTSGALGFSPRAADKWAPVYGLHTGDVHKIALIGDSRAANYFVSYAAGDPLGGKRKTAQHPLAWALALCGQRAQVVYNGGKSGKRSDEWQTLPGNGAWSAMSNPAAAIASGSRWIMIPCDGAVNDISQGYTADQIWNGYNGAPGYKVTLDAIVAAGLRPFLFTEIGATAFNAAQIGHVHKLNWYLRDYAARHPACVLFDTGPLVWNPASTAIAFKTGISGDGTHFTAMGGYTIAGPLAVMLTALIPERRQLISAGHQSYANGGKQICPNPLFLTETGGTVTAPLTGAAPASVTLARTGSATGSASVIDDPNGYGKAIQLGCTWAASGDTISATIDLTQSIALASWQAGRKYAFLAHVEVAAGSVNTSPPMGRFRFVADGTTYETYDLYTDNSTGSGPTAAYAIDIKTDVQVIPTFTNATQVIGRVTLQGWGAGSCTATISRCSVVEDPSW